MSIGPRSRKKRPRNDLDDYLDEVDSRLFCVTRADRQCLHRDLKAHVRELTTDERSADRFGGRYQISMEQLREEIGEPDDIVSMYISSVKTKVPSLGLRLMMLLMAVVFIATITIGIDRYGIGNSLDGGNSGWLKTSGMGLIITGAIALSLVVLAYLAFEKYHRSLAYLVLFTGLFSYPISMVLSRGMTKEINMELRTVLVDWYGIIFLVDIIVIIIIGLYIYLKHFQVMSSEVEVA